MNGSVELGVVFETSGVSVALPFVSDSVTWLINECNVCLLMVMDGAAFVGTDEVRVDNCGVGAGAGKEKSNGMIKLTSATQYTWPQCFKVLMHRNYPLKKSLFPKQLVEASIYPLDTDHPTLYNT